MFLLKHPLYACRLYAFSRHLARFGLQPFLKRLPLRFLTQRRCRKTAGGLPEGQRERLVFFLKQQGIAEKTLSFYMGLYPEIAGEEEVRILLDAFRELDTLPQEIVRQDKQKCLQLIDLFYALTLNGNETHRAAQDFERFLDTASDFRLEAAVLERLNDSFYEEDNVRFSLPEWKETGQNKLVTPEKKDLFDLKDSSDYEKTAQTLSKTIVKMILRDGLVIVPSCANCRTDKQSGVHFIRAFPCLMLSPANRQTLDFLIKTLKTGNLQKTLRLLQTQGGVVTDPSALLSLPENVHKSISERPLGEQFVSLIDFSIRQGVSLPFFLRFTACALNETQHLCQSVLNFSAFELFSQSDSDILSFYPQRQTVASPFTDFKKALSFEKHQTERLRIQNKKFPAFQQDWKKLTEILSRQTAETKFKRKSSSLRIFLILTVLAFLLSRFLFGK